MPASTGRRAAYAPWAKMILTLACLCACGENPGQSSTVYAKPSTQRVAPEIPPHIPLPVLFGAFNPRADPDFAPVPREVATHRGMYLRRQALAAFLRMHDAALADGVDLMIVSAFRSFQDQKRIWEDKWTGRTLVEGKSLAHAAPDFETRARRILEYSAMPGASRHHWGTDIDLGSVSVRWFETVSGRKSYDWLTRHAAEFGFCQTYTAQGPTRPGGYHEEKWHWSYMPTASRFLDDYLAAVSTADFKGFLGAEEAGPVEIIDRYVRGIDLTCKTFPSAPDRLRPTKPA